MVSLLYYYKKLNILLIILQKAYLGKNKFSQKSNPPKKIMDKKFFGQKILADFCFFMFFTFQDYYKKLNLLLIILQKA